MTTEATNHSGIMTIAAVTTTQEVAKKLGRTTGAQATLTIGKSVRMKDADE